MDPSLGRFTQPDTIVPTSTQGTQAWDRYAFVNNNPIKYTDPTGHSSVCGFSYSDPECKEVGTTQTVYAGGVNPASHPSVPGDANNGPSHPIVDGLIELLNIANSIASFIAPDSPTAVDVLYTYTINPDGSISTIIVTVNNHSGGSSVALENVVIGLDDKFMPPPPFSVSVREGEYVLDANHMTVNPGQIKNAVICGNCIANKVLPFFMPIRKSTQVTLTAVIGGFFDFGNQGTNYATFNITFTIPPR